MAGPLVDAKVIEKTITYDGNKQMIIRYRPLTRLVRNQALAKAVNAFSEDNEGRLGYYHHVLERELVAALLVSWELPHPPAIGWDLLSAETDLGEKIAEAIGVNKALETLSGKGPTVDEAKNSSSAAPESSTSG